MILTFLKFQKATWIFKRSFTKRNVNIAKKKFLTQQHACFAGIPCAGSSWKVEGEIFLNARFPRKTSKKIMRDWFLGMQSIMKEAPLFSCIHPQEDFYSCKMDQAALLIHSIEIDMESFLRIVIRITLITKLMSRVVAWKLWPRSGKNIWIFKSEMKFFSRELIQIVNTKFIWKMHYEYIFMIYKLL